jgi:hypothetical protein
MRALAAATLAAAVSAVLAAPALAGRANQQATVAITAGNGDSTNPVISQDRRYSTILAFESTATDLVAGDTNGVRDIFMMRRAGKADNNGSTWNTGPMRLVSKGMNGAPANGPSWAPAIDGGFPKPRDRPTYPKCIAFLSDASNLVRGDTNGVTDAFVSNGPGNTIERVSLPGGRQASAPTTAVSVSVDCTHIAFVTGGRLNVRYRKKLRPYQIRRLPPAEQKRLTKTKYRSLDLPGTAADPQFATGQTDDLVAAADQGVYLIKNGTGRPKLVAPGGRNPTYNDVKCKVVAYEKPTDGHTQIAWRYLGAAPAKFSRSATSVPCDALKRPGEQIASKTKRGELGNGDSVDPSIGDAGFYITFQSAASNLGINSLGRTGDGNGQPDVYLYTAVRDLTLVESVKAKAVPLDAGGIEPAMSWYANYIFFDTPIGGTAATDPSTTVATPGGGIQLPVGLPQIPGPVAPVVPVTQQGGAATPPVRQIYVRYLGPV